MDTNWDSLVLPEPIKEQLKAACRAIRGTEAAQAQGSSAPYILLYGPPGTGKTHVARVMATDSGVAFVAATAADLKGTFVGESFQKVRQVFTKARGSAPCILFFDDLESVATDQRSSNADWFTRDIVNQMLQELDGLKMDSARVMIIAATNQPGKIDEAVRRRFASQIAIPLPDETGRRQILHSLLAQCPLAPGLDADQVAAEMAQATQGRSGRDLLLLVERAMQGALTRSASPAEVKLTHEGLLAALSPESAVKPAAVAPTMVKPAQVMAANPMPIQATPAEAQPGQGTTEGIPENVAGLLCYALFWISGLIFFLTDKRPFVRFHAAQSMVVFGGLNVVYFVLVRMWFASYGSLAGLLLELARLAVAVLWIVLMVKAYQGERFKVPVAVELTEKILAQ